MKLRLLAAAVLAGLCATAGAATNVALNGSVSLTGADFGNGGSWGSPPMADPATVTDGTLLALNTQWNTGTVYWSGALGADTVTITLPTLSSVSSIALQADNNDDYGISYKGTDDLWHALTTISPNRSWGMDMGSASFASVTASAFAITAVGGDGFYAVSEFQAIGAPVPEPETYALLLSGLGVVGLLSRRRSTR